MLNKTRLRKLILKEIGKYYKIGKQLSSDGHLDYVRITDLEIVKLKEIENEGEIVFEVIFTFKTHTETEFEHTKEIDKVLTRSHRDVIVVDRELRVLEYNSEIIT